MPPPAPPQRQSCDRCHRQKLRCKRTKNTNGDVCDRCLTKPAECVYSTSLPKGRPSLRRLAVDAPNNASADDATSARDAIVPITSASPLVTPTTSPPILDPSLNPYSDLVLDTLPPVGSGWDRASPRMPWTGLSFNGTDALHLLPGVGGFDANGNAQDDMDFFASFASSFASTPPRTSRSYEQPAIRRHDSRNGSVDVDAGSKNPSAVISQLSQLSVQLSTLRASSHSLAHGADSTFGQGPLDGHAPLLDSAAFESVVAWLTHVDNPNLAGLIHSPIDVSTPWPDAGTQLHILRDVFAASQRLMEILRHVQADEIMRHLIMACEALLLEIYAAILTALEHEACPVDLVNSTALGNVRLVLIVQLCAYVIERQHQVVGHCLAQNQNVSNMSSSGYFVQHATDREPLKSLKVQVQQRLTRLRKMLRCH